MLRAIIISPDQELTDGLEKILAEVGIAAVTRRLDRYPSAVELSRTLRAQAPQVVFLSIVSLEKAQEVVTAVESYASGIQIVAMNRACDPQTLLEVMRIGIREFVSMPFQRQQMVDTLLRVSEVVEKKPPAIGATDMLYSFLPSKAGVGATTIAVNTSVALATFPLKILHRSCLFS